MKFLRLIFYAFGDLFTRYLPQLNKKTGFAFIVHPRDMSDVYRKYPVFKYFPDNFTASFLRNFWPVTLSKVTGVKNKNGEEIPGWIISIPITAGQMMNNMDLARRFIIKAAKLSEKKGSKIIGLGALTASLTSGGKDVSPHIKSYLTTGRLYTSKIIADTTEAISKKIGLDKNSIVAIVGAAGSIGTACSQILAKRGFRNFLLVDLSNKKYRTEILKNKILSLKKNSNIEISENISSILSADIIIAATNKPEALIRSKDLKKGAIVIDDAQPSDVDQDIIENREDVIVLEGGLVKTQNIKTNFDMGLHFKDNMYSCLAESIILSMAEQNKDFQVGEIFEVNWKIIENLELYEKKFGFTIAPFQNIKKVYTEDDFQRTINIIK